MKPVNDTSNHDEIAKVCQYSNLPDAILNELFDGKKGQTRRMYLFNSGIFPASVTHDTSEEIIYKLFKEYEIYREQGQYFLFDDRNADAQKVYEDICELLIVSGIGELITLGDWSVNRMTMAERRHGLQENGFYKLQLCLSQKYGWNNPIHFHDGPGNGILPYMLSKQGKDNPSDTEWRQLGIGDKLYFPIEDIVSAFVKPIFSDNPQVRKLIGIICAVLKVKLKEKWYDSNGSARIEDFVSKDAFHDVNDIYQELRSLMDEPREYLGRVFEAETGTILASGKFEYDSKLQVGDTIFHSALLSMMGYPEDEVLSLTEKHHSNYADNWRTLYLRDLQSLQTIKNTIKSTILLQDGIIPKEITPVTLRDIDRITQGAVRIDLDKWNDDAFLEVNEKYSEGKVHMYRAEIYRQILSQISDMEALVKKHNLLATRPKKSANSDSKKGLILDRNKKFNSQLGLNGKKLSVGEFIKAVFTKEFVGEIASQERHRRVNLNRHVNMYFGDFNLGDFLEAPSIIPVTTHLRTATKSDSHMSGKSFLTKVAQSVQGLPPGGVFMTEGVKTSFSDIYKFHEIHEALKASGIDDYKAEVVIDKLERRIITIFIQRKHNDRYLTNEEKASFFSSDVEFESIEKPMGRPYMRGINKLRKRVLALTNTESKREEGDVKIFQALQPLLRKFMNVELVNVAVDSLNNQSEGYLSSLAELYESIRLYCIVESYVSGDRVNFWKDTRKVQEYISSLYELESIPEEVRHYIYDDNISGLMSRFQGLSLGDTPTSSLLSTIEEVYSEKIDKNAWEYIRQLVRDNEDTGILSSDDVKRVVSQALIRVEEVLPKYKGKIKPKEKGTLKPIPNGTVDTYKRIGIGFDPHINQRYSTKVSSLADNAQFLQIEAALGGRINKTKGRLNDFRNQVNSKEGVSGCKPLCFISYTDCITNKFMKEELERIYGKQFIDENLHIIEMERRPLDIISPDTIRHFGKIKRELDFYKEHGGIIIGGGSWTDAYDAFGLSYKEHLGEDLLDAIEENPKLRQWAICASYQITADLIGAKYYNGEIITKPGMVQFGATNVGLTREKRGGVYRHEVFRDFPDYFTTAMTHTGWVCDNRKGKVQNNKHIRFIATDTLTGNPLAYTAMDDQILGTQWHSEINMNDSSKLDQLGKELKGARDFFVENFGIGPGSVMHSFYQAVNGDTPHLKADSGKAVIVNSLEYLSRDLAT